MMAHLTHEVVRWKGFREAFEDQLFRGLIHLCHQVLLEGGEEQRFANETSTCASQSRYRGVEVQSKAYTCSLARGHQSLGGGKEGRNHTATTFITAVGSDISGRARRLQSIGRKQMALRTPGHERHDSGETMSDCIGIREDDKPLIFFVVNLPHPPLRWYRMNRVHVPARTRHQLYGRAPHLAPPTLAAPQSTPSKFSILKAEKLLLSEKFKGQGQIQIA